ncbi:MAG: peptide chain release factor N(5)-glutamine methyltransferase [Deltaproteobacteria bacterium]|nr:peptide chain release factor N(5)-glutamine methyltransferase [Deltaproteobacteria bacterium]
MATIEDLRNYGYRILADVFKTQADNLAYYDPRLDADVILQFVVKKDLAYIIINAEEELEENVVRQYKELLDRRKLFEPVAYILGQKEFYGINFYVDKRVLIPRPETELVIDQALKCFNKETSSFFLCDIGVGSGAIVLSIVHELCRRFGRDYLQRGKIVATDISEDALSVFSINCSRLGYTSLISAINTNIIQGLEISKNNSLCLFVSNPPYVMDGQQLARDISGYEPTTALYSGPDGLDAIRALMQQTSAHMNSGAKLIFEFGESQATGINGIVIEHVGKEPVFLKDLAGINRICMVGS